MRETPRSEKDAEPASGDQAFGDDPAVPDSRTAPQGYQPAVVEPGPALATKTLSGGPILVLMDVLPWDSDAIQTILDSYGAPYFISGSAEIPALNLNAFSGVIIASDQPQKFYNTYAAHIAKFEAFVTAGGRLHFHTAANGWNSGVLNGISLPGGGTIIEDNDSANWVADPAHAVMSGVPNPFIGSYASHSIFQDIRSDARVIATQGSVAGGAPTLIEYNLGTGTVLAFGQTLEFGYMNSESAGLILENSILLMVSELEPQVVVTPPIQNGVARRGSTEVYSFQILNFTEVSQAFSLAVNSSWPASLSVSETSVLAHKDLATVSVSVTVPATAPIGASSELTLTATSKTSPTVYTASVTARTYAGSGNNGYIMGGSKDEIIIFDKTLNMIAERLDVGGGSKPIRADLSPDGKWLYATLMNIGSVLVLDTRDDSLGPIIPVDDSPLGIAFTPDGAYALVTNQGSNTVSVISTATHSVAHTITVGDRPVNVAMDGCQKRAFVVAQYSGEVYVIDLASMTVDGVIADLNAPGDVVVSPYGHLLYVMEKDSDTIAVVDINNREILDRWQTGGYWLSSLDISPDGTLLYVSDADSGAVYALDTLNGGLLATISVEPDDENVWDVEFAPPSYGNFAFAGLPFTRELVVLDTETHTVADRYNLNTQVRGLKMFPKTYTCQAGALIFPAEQAAFDAPGEVVKFEGRLFNASTQTRTFSLSLPNTAWNAQLSASTTGPLAAGATFDFLVTATVPPTAAAGERVTLEVIASASGISTRAQMLAAVPLPGYVFEPKAGRVGIIDLLSHQNTGWTIELSSGFPWRGALSPDASALYASLRDDNEVAVIDLADPASVTRLSVNDSPHGISFSLDGSQAYVANRGSSSVSVIDTESLTVTDTLAPLGDGPQSIAVDACQNKIYLTNLDDDLVMVLDASTLDVTQVITASLDGPWGIVTAPLGGRAYVSNAWSREITVIDTLTDEVITTWSVAPGEDLANLDISPDGRKLYVVSTQSGWLYALDTTTGEVINKVLVGNGDDWGQGWDVKFLPYELGPYAYVTAPDARMVRVIDTRTDTLVQSAYFKGRPRGLALAPQQTVCGQLPDGNFTQSANSVFVGQAVSFTSTVTAGVPAPSLTWDFGDGATSSEANPSHAYSKAGHYTTTLVIENQYGQVVRTRSIVVLGKVYMPLMRK